MKNRTVQCLVENYYATQNLTNTQATILIVINAILFVGNISSNSLVIYLLVKTHQLSNYSLKFILLLSSADIATAFTVQTLQVPTFYLSLDLPCLVYLFTQLFSTTFPRISGYTVGLIGIDRYVRLRYRTTFRRVLTPTRAYILMIATCVLSFLNGTLTTAASSSNDGAYFRGMATFIDISVITLVITLQLRIICIMRATVRASENPEIFDETSTKIVKLASRVMVLFIVCFIPFNLVLLTRNIFADKFQGSSKSYIEFFFRLSYFGSYINSIGNAVLFFITNVRAGEYLRNKFQPLLSGNNRVVLETPMIC